MTVEWGTRVPRMGPAGKVSYGLALVGEIPAIVVPGKTQGDKVDAALHTYVGRRAAPR